MNYHWVSKLSRKRKEKDPGNGEDTWDRRACEKARSNLGKKGGFYK